MNDADRPLDAFHQHEVVHLAMVVSEMFESYIEQHAYTKSNEQLRAAAADITARLAEFYQLAAATERA